MSQAATSLDDAPAIDLRNLLYMAIVFLALAGIIALDNVWLMNFVHVMAGALWTGIDLFMGFVVGPILKGLPMSARQAFVLRLTPKTLFLLPTLSIVTSTAGWFHAQQIGLLNAPWPGFGWVVAALVIVAVLTIQGLGFLLPTNLKVYFELRKPQPNGARIGRLMRWYFLVVAIQGVMQLAIIVVMAKFVTGL